MKPTSPTTTTAPVAALRRRARRFRTVWSAVRHLDTAERLFALSVIGLIVVVGVVGPPARIQWYIAIVLWSALVGMMVPGIIDARRSSSDDDAQAAASNGLSDPRISHDVASALLTIEGSVCALRIMNQSNVPELETVTHAIETEVRRIRRLSGPRTGRISGPCEVSATLEPLLELHRTNGVPLTADLAAATVAMGCDDLVRAVTNLVDNCLRHAPGAPIVVTGHVADGRYSLTVRDTGPGIDPSLAERVLDEGVSSREGGGYGLANVVALAEAAAGSVVLAFDERGTAVTLDLPLVAASVGDVDSVAV